MHLYLITLEYCAPLGEVDALLDEHKAFLRRHYESGIFLLSGRREPRTGGVILARAHNTEVITSAVSEDPFCREGVAEYSIVEFVPSKAGPGLEWLLDSLANEQGGAQAV
ncbi:MAG: YciI family protein [Bacteroidota bacterium]